MDLKKKGFHLPDKIRFDEDTLSATYGKLMAEPMERGYATTLGAALRRVLLSSIEGSAATGMRLRGAVHEFATIEGVKEDVVDIVLNTKGLRFRIDGSSAKTATIKVTGPKTVKAGDLALESGLSVMNPNHLIATVDKGVEFDAEIYVEKGFGYRVAETQKVSERSVDVIAIDSIFSPVTKVNMQVERARVGRATDYDRLVLEIWTDGSISPQAALSQAATIMAEHIDLFILEEEPETYEEGAVDETYYDDAATLNRNLLKSVDELELSVRAHNCLKNADIKNISDLVQKTEYEMLRTKNFGRKSLNEIKEILNTMGLTFGMRIDPKALDKLRSDFNEA